MSDYTCPHCGYCTDAPSWSDCDEIELNEQGVYAHTHRHVPVCPKCHQQTTETGVHRVLDTLAPFADEPATPVNRWVTVTIIALTVCAVALVLDAALKLSGH